MEQESNEEYNSQRNSLQFTELNSKWSKQNKYQHLEVATFR